MKKQVIGKRIAMLLCLMMALTAVPGAPLSQRTAYAATEDTRKGAVQTFNTEAQINKNLTCKVNNYQQSATPKPDGTTDPSTSKVSISIDKNFLPKPNPESDGSFWRVDFEKGNRPAVEARYDIGFDKDVASLAVGSKFAIEEKVYYESVYQQLALFYIGASNGDWLANNPLILLKAQPGEQGRNWIIKDVNGAVLESFDKKEYQNESGTVDDKKVKAAWEKQWHHFYIEIEVLENDQIAYSIYHNGKRVGTERSVFSINSSAAGAAGVKRLINNTQHWGNGFTLVDDIVVRTLAAADFSLQNSTVTDGQIGADVSRGRIMLDFNTLIDETTLKSAVLKKKADGTAVAGVSASTDEIDKSRLILTLENPLEEETEYLLDYSGLKDIHGTPAQTGSLTFQSGAAIPREPAAVYSEEHFDSASTVENGTVEDGVLHLSPSGSAVEMRNSIEFENEIHTFADAGSATVMELKVKAKSIGNVRSLFGGSDQKGVWYDVPVQEDAGGFMAPAGLPNNVMQRQGDYAANRWYHVYLVARGNSYDFYVDGVKMNETPLRYFAGTNDVVSAGLTGIKKLHYSHKVWGADESWWDDIVVQKLTYLQAQKSSLDGLTGEAPLSTSQITLDFNNLIDPSTLGAVKLFDGVSEQPLNAALLSGDATQMTVTVPDGVLTPDTAYELRYAGLKDLFGTAADGRLSFTTESAPGEAELLSASPESGATVGLTGVEPSLTFKRRLKADTVKPEYITVKAAGSAAPDVPVAKAELTGGKTIQLAFGSNLLAGKTYTVTLGEQIKTEDGSYGIAENSRTYTFRTWENANAVTNEFERLSEGVGGIWKIDGSFKIEGIDLESFEGDTSRVTLGPSEESSLIFDLGGNGDYSFEYFDVNYNPNSGGDVTKIPKAKLFISESADGETFTAPVRLMAFPELGKAPDVFPDPNNPGQEYVPEYTPQENEAIPTLVRCYNGEGVQNIWRCSGVLAEGNRYLRITMQQTTPGISCWTPRLRNIKLNQNAPQNTDSVLVSTVPANGNQAAPRTKTITLNYDTPLYMASVKKENFTIQGSGNPEISELYLSQDRRQVKLTLSERMKPNTAYTVSASGVYNLYDKQAPCELSFTTENVEVTVTGAVLLDEQGNETEFGAKTMTPRFVLQNYMSTAQPAALIAAVYNGQQLEQAVTQEVLADPGSNTVTFDKKLTVDHAEGRTVKLLAWSGFDTMKPLPREQIGEVDTEFFPGYVRKAVTLSYDDGPIGSDLQMIKILDKYGVKATFNLNSVKLSEVANLAEYQAAYSGHEIANHSKTHPHLDQIPFEQSGSEALDAKSEIMLGQSELEEAFQREVRGFAYPYNRITGSGTELQIVRLLEETGHVYGRPSNDNGHSFELPADWQNWRFTAHHTDSDFLELCQRFYEAEPERMQLLAVWGHSWEFAKDDSKDRPDTWDTLLVPFCEGVEANQSQLWCATNIEIYDYIQAKNNLEIDQSSIYNPSGIDVYVKVDGQEVLVPAHERVYPS